MCLTQSLKCHFGTHSVPQLIQFSTVRQVMWLTQSPNLYFGTHSVGTDSVPQPMLNFTLHYAFGTLLEGTD
jgi:hypothetical protein